MFMTSEDGAQPVKEGHSDVAASGSWKDFVRKHWGAAIVFALAAVAAFAWGVYVFWWFVGNAQSTGLVPSSLGLWTMKNLIYFGLYSIFWELLLVGIPAIMGVVVAWSWWRKLPFEERTRFHWGRSRSRNGSSGFSAFLFIAFAVKVWLDGNWNVALATFSLNYVVGSVIEIIAVFAVVFGIPAAIVGTWWVRRQLRKL